MTTVDQERSLGLGAGGSTEVAPEPHPGGEDGRPPAGPGRGTQRSRWTRMVAAAVAIGGLYALGAQLPFWFLSSPDAGAAFFPSAGVTLAALLLAPRRTWPLLVIAVAVAEVAVDLTHGQSVPMALGFAAANVAEPLVGAAGLTAAVTGARSLRAQLLLFVAFAVVLGPMIGGAIGGLVAVSWGSGGAWGPIAGRWWLGDAIGVLVVATPLLVWVHPPRFGPPLRPGAIAATTALATAIVLVPALAWHHPLVYAVLPVLMWAAVQGGVRTVTIAGLGMAFAVDWAAVTGRASQLVDSGTPVEQLVQVQLFLAVTLLAGLLLAVEVVERRRTEAELLAAEQERHRTERGIILAAAAERRRVAGDIHDTIGHALNVILLQAGAARRSVEDDTGLTRELLESIETTGRSAFRDLDVALGLIDRRSLEGAAPGLEAIPLLVDTLRRAGLRVELVVDTADRPLSTIVGRSAYRVVQEALTNVSKHAPDAGAVVRVHREARRLVVTVSDDGWRAPSRRSPPGGGRGLLGLRERVAVLGGDLESGPTPGGGFQVRASFPVLGAAT
jgi:signal transduction histidine kinase